MISQMDYTTLIALKLKGLSNAEVARQTGVSRETVRKRWIQYRITHELLVNAPEGSEEYEAAKALIIERPRYNNKGRPKRKYNDEIDQLLDKILEDEEEKAKLLTTKKQQLTSKQIHRLIVAEGHDIGLSTISNMVRIKRDRRKEAYIRQTYEYGDRFEYDFGEAEVFIGDKKQKVQIAVITCCASGYRFARLYRDQGMATFLDSHVQFFEEAGGVPKEGVYDNMRNVVAKFTGRGRTDKDLNSELLKMAAFYGFSINTTNARKGNEKGSVEESVKYVRNQTFAVRYRFKSFDEMKEWFEKEMEIVNKGKQFDEEKKHLLPYPGKYETAVIQTNKVDKYSFISVKTNFYSVPDDLVGQMVTVKIYPDYLLVMYNGEIVARHNKIDGKKKVCADIRHYLHTLKRKPGALKNSTVLKSNPVLEEFFEKHFSGNPREFIDFLHRYPKADAQELFELYKKEQIKEDVKNSVTENTKNNINEVKNLFRGGKTK